MTKRTHENCLAFLVATGFVMLCLAGCGGTDLRGYRPAREHSAQESSAEASAKQTSDSSSAENDASISANRNDSESLVSRTESSANDSEFLPVSAIVPVNMIDGGNVRGLMSIPATDPGVVNDATDASKAAVASNSLNVAAPESRKIELLVKDKVFQTESKTGALRLSFDDLDLLKVLNMDPVAANAVDLMPDWLRGINGKTVRLRGYMYPTFEAEGIEHFVLARDNQICCFGRDPKIYDLVQIDMKEGKSTIYIPPTRAFDVVGKFKIDLQSQDGKLYGLYSIDQAVIIDR